MIDLSQNLLPALSSEEEDRLRASIAEQGFDPAYPVVVDEDGNVLDGWHRKRIAEELGIEPVIVVKAGLSHWEKVKLAVGRNIDRRQLDRWQTGRLAQKLLPEAEEAAAERRVEGGRKGGQASGQMSTSSARQAAAASTKTEFNPPANDATIERHRDAGKARDEVGSLLGVTGRTVDRAVRDIEAFEAQIEEAGISEERWRPVMHELDMGRIGLRQAKDALGFGPPKTTSKTAPVPVTDDRAKLLQLYAAVTEKLSAGFTIEEATELRRLAPSLFVAIRHIERLYCEAKGRA